MDDTKNNFGPPEWYSQIDFGKMESFLRSGESVKVVNDTMGSFTPAEKAIDEMTLVPSQKIKEPYTI